MDYNILESISLNESLSENSTFRPNVTEDELPIDMTFNAGHRLSIAVYSILFGFSAVGNLTVLIMLLRRRRARSLFPPMDFMLLNLAIADLMVTFLMMPLEIAWNSTVSWNGGDFLCRIMAFFRIFGLFLSSFVLVCLAVDRYMAVKHPMQVLDGVRRSKQMILVSWILSIFCSFPQAIIFHVENHPTFTWYAQCVVYSSFPSPAYELAYFLFGMFFMYLGPFIIIVALYCGIVVELIRRHQESSHQLHSRNGGEGLRRSGIGNIGKAKGKALKMTVLIALCFFICWTPYYVISLWYYIDQESFRELDPLIQKSLFFFACTNSTVNPIVYGIYHLRSSIRRDNASIRRNGALVRNLSHVSVNRSVLNNLSTRVQATVIKNRREIELPTSLRTKSNSSTSYV